MTAPTPDPDYDTIWEYGREEGYKAGRDEFADALADVTAERDDAIRNLAIAEHAGAWVPEVDETTHTVLWDAPCRCHGVVLIPGEET